MNLLLYKDGKLVVSESGKPLENANALDNLVACIADPSDGDSIVYDGTNHMWKAGGSFDPTITDPQNGDTLVYNATQSKWVNGAGGGSFDPDITNPQDGDTLVYNATQQKWINGAGGGGSGGGFLKVGMDAQTGTLDKTWKEIDTAVKAGYYVSLVSEEPNTAQLCLSNTYYATGIGQYGVVGIASGNEVTFITDSENGYPVLSQG